MDNEYSTDSRQSPQTCLPLKPCHVSCFDLYYFSSSSQIGTLFSTTCLLVGFGSTHLNMSVLNFTIQPVNSTRYHSDTKQYNNHFSLLTIISPDSFYQEKTAQYGKILPSSESDPVLRVKEHPYRLTHDLSLHVPSTKSNNISTKSHIVRMVL